MSTGYETRGSMLPAQRALRACFVAIAGALAAAIAHVVIDVAGDYVLVRDAYDGIAHHSRTLLVAAVGVAMIVVVVRTIFDALDRRGASTISLLTLLRGALVRPFHFAVASTGVALGSLVAMESFDCALAGHIDDIDDLFGGSLLLGIVTVLATGMLCGWLVHRLLRWIAAYEAPIVAFILAVLRPGGASAAALAPQYAAHIAPDLNRALLRSQRRHKRGPPAAALG